MSTLPKTRTCLGCKNPFPKNVHGGRRYCSEACRKAHTTTTAKKLVIDLMRDNTTQTYTWSRTFAAQDLMLQGFSVYTPESQVSPYSLIAVRNEEVYRVHVCTQRADDDGEFTVTKAVKDRKWDILALVVPEYGMVFYRTRLPIELSSPVLQRDVHSIQST